MIKWMLILLKIVTYISCLISWAAITLMFGEKSFFIALIFSIYTVFAHALALLGIDALIDEIEGGK